MSVRKAGLPPPFLRDQLLVQLFGLVKHSFEREFLTCGSAIVAAASESERIIDEQLGYFRGEVDGVITYTAA